MTPDQDPRVRNATSDFPYEPSCRLFTGYRPCVHRRSCVGCPHLDPVGSQILLINLDGLGDVLRSTALLPPLRSAFPGCRVHWLTRERARPLIENHPLLDRVHCIEHEGIQEVECMEFDHVLNVDRSRLAAGLATRLRAKDRRGFGLEPHGNIVPFNPEARYLYDCGLDDDLKFRRNTLSVPEMTTLALGLPYRREPYRLHLAGGAIPGPSRRVGFNTGSNPGFPRKRLDLDTIEATIRQVSAFTAEPVLLLGGVEDWERNQALQERLGDRVEWEARPGTVMDGALQVARCSVVVSGDSLGLHLAIGLGRYVVAWFGLTCPQEIDVFDRGVRVLADVDCAPCWRRSCDREPACNRSVDPDLLARAVGLCLDRLDAGEGCDEVWGGGWWWPDLRTPAPR